MSIHVWRSQDKARNLGAAAAEEHNDHLWSLSKRELVEVALHLASALTCEEPFSAVTTDRVNLEVQALRNNKSI